MIGAFHQPLAVLIDPDFGQDEALLEVWPSAAQNGEVRAERVEYGWKMKDMEGLALDAGGDLWMSSSGSRKNSGEFDDGRLQIARFRPGLGGGPMASLRTGEGDPMEAVRTALSDPRCPGCQLPDGFAKASPDAGGFNIEGLPFYQGKMLFGLRAPETLARQTVVLEAPAPERSGGALAWSGAYALDLGGRGVRAMETTPDGQLVLVLGGPGALAIKGDPTILYAWRPGGAITALGPIPDEMGSPPEAIALDGQGRLWVLYDAGDAIKAAHGGKFECAQLAAREPALARVISQRFTLHLDAL